MIDTICLTLEEGQFNVFDPERFTPHADFVLKPLGHGGRGVRKATLNPNKQDFENGEYAPRLTLTRPPVGPAQLRIEFSIPKLLYGNNFDEVSEVDFDAVIFELGIKLGAVRVLVFQELLKKAAVTSIHYSKNIVLPRHTLCQSVVSMLAKVPISRWYDTGKVEYRNHGHLYKVHSNSFELAFYDKLKDLEQSREKGDKRSVEKENVIQHSMLPVLQASASVQVLRMEARLGNRTKIQQILKRVGWPNDDLRFDALFKKDVAQKILLHLWGPYKKDLPLIIMAERETPEALLNMLQRAFPDASMNLLLKHLGTLQFVGKYGWSGLRACWKGDSRNYDRLKTSLEALPTADVGPLGDLAVIDAGLTSMKPVKIEEYIQLKPLSCVADRRM